MYTGANSARTAGAARQAEANPKKRRSRPKKRKRNPSVAMITTIAGVSAVVVGAGIAYAVNRSRKKKAEAGLPIVPTPEISPGPGQPPSPQQTAPTFPGKRGQDELDQATAQVVIWASNQPTERPSSSQIDDMSDTAYRQAYPGGPFPLGGSKGGWKPWADAWIRIRNHVRSVVNTTYGAEENPGRIGSAPPFPFTTGDAKTLETTWAIAYVAENCDPVAGALSKSLNALANDVFFEMYQISKPPVRGDRGNGWKPYIDSWLRIRDDIEEQASAAGC